MLEHVIDGLRVATELVLASPWLLLVIFGLAVLDALLPVVPSEALIVAAGVGATTGEQNLVLVIGAAAAGSFVGESIGYGIGRVVGPPLRTRLKPGSQIEAAYDQMRALIHSRGGAVLLGGRFLPAGRTAAVLAAGAAGYPLSRFFGFTAVGVFLSAGWQSLIGYFGGAAFAGDPLLALAAGLTLATLIGFVVEAIRRARHRDGESGAAAPAPRDVVVPDEERDAAVGAEPELVPAAR